MKRQRDKFPSNLNWENKTYKLKRSLATSAQSKWAGSQHFCHFQWKMCLLWNSFFFLIKNWHTRKYYFRVVKYYLCTRTGQAKVCQGFLNAQTALLVQPSETLGWVKRKTSTYLWGRVIICKESIQLAIIMK